MAHISISETAFAVACILKVMITESWEKRFFRLCAAQKLPIKNSYQSNIEFTTFKMSSQIILPHKRNGKIRWAVRKTSQNKRDNFIDFLIDFLLISDFDGKINEIEV